MEGKVARAISLYLEGRIDLDTLQDELTQMTWDNPRPPADALQAELLIAEFTNGDRSEKSLHDALGSLVLVAA